MAIAGLEEDKRRRERLKGCAILALTLIAYAPALRAGFIWDDDSHFTKTPMMAGTLWGLWSEHHFYYPLTSTTWWFARRIWGLTPWPYHLLNVLLHAANSLLLWRLLARLKVPGGWMAGAIFALHPVNVQSVAWATELKNCQSGLFYLLTLHAWERFEEKGNWKWWGVALACFVAALLSKTSTVTLPVALVVMHLWRREKTDRRAVAAWLPFPALSLLAGGLTVLGHGPMVEGDDWNLTIAQRFALAGRCVWFYLEKLIWPMDQSFVYPRWPLDVTQAPTWIPLAALIVLAVLLIFLQKKGTRPALFALVYFVGSLVPVLNFFKMYYARYSYVADHWQYLAAMGAIAWGAGTAAWLMGRLDPQRRKFFGALIGSLVLIFFGGKTWLQTQVYKDGEILWFDVLEHNPGVAVAYNNLTFVYSSRGDTKMALATATTGHKLNPNDLQLKGLLGAVLVTVERYPDALAILQDADKQQPNDPENLNNMGLALAGMGRKTEAIEYFQRTIDRFPHFAEPYNNLAKTLMESGRKTEAVSVLERGLAQSPDSKVLRNALGIVRAQAEPTAGGGHQ